MGRFVTSAGKRWVGTVLIVLAALFYGAMNISIKLSTDHLSVWQTAMGRFAMGVALIPILTWQLRLDLFGRQRWLLLFRGVSATGAFLLLVQAMKMIPLSITMILFYLWPVFSCLLSSWIAGEQTTKREWGFVGGAVLGAVFILWPDQASAMFNIGYFFALGSSLLAGLAIILVRRLGRDNNPFTLYFYFCLVGGIICIGPLIGQDSSFLPVSATGWFGLIAVAVFAMTAQMLMNQGMKYMNAPKTGVLMLMEVLVATFFGVFYLGEPLSIKILCGAGLILGCGVALILIPVKSK